MSRWWAHNRWWLVVLPAALAFFLLAGADRFWDLRQQRPSHIAATAEPGDWVEFHQTYTDAVGKTTRDVEVKLVRVGRGQPDLESDGSEPATPDDAALWEVALDFKADPDQVLGGCTVTLLDDSGRRFEPLGNDAAFQCVNAGSTGPLGPMPWDRARPTAIEEPRPPTWSTTVSIWLPEGTKPSRVQVQWDPPDVVEFRLPR